MGCQSPAWPVCRDGFVLIASGLFHTSSVDVFLHQPPELRSSRECSQHGVHHQAFRGPVCQHLTEAKLGGEAMQTLPSEISLQIQNSPKISSRKSSLKENQNLVVKLVLALCPGLYQQKKSMSLEMYWLSLPQNKAWRKHGSEEEGET